MYQILLVENDGHDSERLQALIADEDVEVVLCADGAEAEAIIAPGRQGEFAAAIILWETPGRLNGFSLLARCRRLWPNTPAVITSGMLDARLATRALAMGAADFLQKPFEAERVKSCIQSIINPAESISPLVEKLRETIIGDSSALLTAIKRTARIIPHDDSRTLLIGESGTGKELFAQAIHRLSNRSKAPWIAVNVGEITPTLIESILFGYEKGAFTGAHARRTGYLEQAKNGTLFLDEIGELEIALQVKLLRVIQEKEFRRIGGEKSLPFEARLVCATNRDLSQAVKQGTFRQDLFHRIAEKTILIPSLRERDGDIRVLLDHFLDAYRDSRNVKFARETLTILGTYPFPGNVRELQNLVKSALIDCDGDLILPGHLPFPNMAVFLQSDGDNNREQNGSEGASMQPPSPHKELFEEIEGSLPDNWLSLPHSAGEESVKRAFDRVYLKNAYERNKESVPKAAAMAKIDKKTFRSRWEKCGLPPLKPTEEGEDV